MLCTTGIIKKNVSMKGMYTNDRSVVPIASIGFEDLPNNAARAIKKTTATNAIGI